MLEKPRRNLHLTHFVVFELCSRWNIRINICWMYCASMSLNHTVLN